MLYFSFNLMIQVSTLLTVIDNSGAKKAYCIKILTGYQKFYGLVGDVILVSIKKIRAKRKLNSKVKKGLLYRGIIVSTKVGTSMFSGEKTKFFENCIILLGKQRKPIGTRVVGFLPKNLRYTGFLRILSMSKGTIK